MEPRQTVSVAVVQRSAWLLGYMNVPYRSERLPGIDLDKRTTGGWNISRLDTFSANLGLFCAIACQVWNFTGTVRDLMQIVEGASAICLQWAGTSAACFDLPLGIQLANTHTLDCAGNKRYIAFQYHLTWKCQTLLRVSLPQVRGYAVLLCRHFPCRAFRLTHLQT